MINFRRIRLQKSRKIPVSFQTGTSLSKSLHLSRFSNRVCMLSINQSKFIRSLAVKKYRQQHKRFVVEGEKMVAELLMQSGIEVDAVFGTEKWIDTHKDLNKAHSDKLNLVSTAELGKISNLNTPNEVLAVAVIPEAEPDCHWPAVDICLYLDGIQDPGNLGTILRLADWFGIPAVYCAPNTVDIFNAKVIQASMGAIFRVRSWEISLQNLLTDHPELPVMGAFMDGENVFDSALPSNGVLVIGNEGAGISIEHEKMLNRKLSIPRHPNGGAESLNAAMAAGILIAQFNGSRQTGSMRR